MGAQHPRAGRVEGHHPHRAHATPDQQPDTLTHLLGGLVREGDREDLVRLRGAGREQIRDPVGQDPGLARPGTGEDQERPAGVGDRVTLGLVQPLQEGVKIARRLRHRLLGQR